MLTYLCHSHTHQQPQHLERNRKDKDSKFRLILIESRIHRLARYYRTTYVCLCPSSSLSVLVCVSAWGNRLDGHAHEGP